MKHKALTIRVALSLSFFLSSNLPLRAQSSVSDQSAAPSSPAPSLSSPTRALDPALLTMVRQRQWKEVIGRANSLHAANPTDYDVLYWMGIANLQLHQPVNAVLAFRTAEKLGLNTALFYEGLGLAYYDLNQFVLFEQEMQKAAHSDALDSKPYYYLGLYRVTIRSDTARGLQLFETATQLNPDDWKSLYQQGYCLEQMGKRDEARERYAKAVNLVEKSGAHFGWPFQGLARLMTSDQPQQALGFAQKAVALEPNEPSNHLVLSSVDQSLGNLQGAQHEAEIAASQNPTDAPTHYALYKLYREAKDPRAATELKTFDEVTKLYGAN